MMKYYSNGETEKLPSNPRLNHVAQHIAEPGVGAKIYERNYLDQFSHNYKPITSGQKPNTDLYKKEWLKSNSDFKQKDYFREEQNNNVNTNIQLLDPSVNGQTSSTFYPTHVPSYRILRSRQFSRERYLPTCKNCGTITSKDFYKQTLIKERAESCSELVNMQRSNFYVSKPNQDVKINKDFPKEKLVKNIAVVSQLLPEWCQRINKHYSVQSMNALHQIRLKSNPKIKCDVFGNQKIQQEKKKEREFVLRPPTIDLLREKNRMVPQDYQQKNLQKYSFVWAENVSQQNYDQVKLSNKIGYEDKVYLPKKTRIDPQITSKIGSVDYRTDTKTDKLIQLKIGHGQPENLQIK